MDAQRGKVRRGIYRGRSSSAVRIPVVRFMAVHSLSVIQCGRAARHERVQKLEMAAWVLRFHGFYSFYRSAAACTRKLFTNSPDDASPLFPPPPPPHRRACAGCVTPARPDGAPSVPPRHPPAPRPPRSPRFAARKRRCGGGFCGGCSGQKQKNVGAKRTLLRRGGGDKGTRTPDFCIANAALYQLSYIPKPTVCHASQPVYHTTVRGKMQEIIYAVYSFFPARPSRAAMRTPPMPRRSSARA